MRKIKLCILTDYMVTGGAEKVVCDAIDALYPRYDITVWTLGGNVSDPIRDRLQGKAHITGTPISSHARILAMFPVIGSWILRRKIPEHFDVMIVLRSSFLMASRSGIAQKAVFWDHSDKANRYTKTAKLSIFRKINRYRLIYGYRKFDAVWVVSDVIRHAFAKAFQHHNVLTVPNPIDIPLIQSLACEPVKIDLFSENAFRFVVVSRLSEEKGVLRVLQAMERLKTQKSCVLLIVGDGPERESLETFVDNHGLRNRVSFAGNQINPYPFIVNSDALICPSYVESFGIAILEAMALRTAVLATKTTGGQSLLADGRYGILAENSVDGLLEGMRTIIEGNPLGTEDAYLHSLKFDQKTFETHINLQIEHLTEGL